MPSIQRPRRARTLLAASGVVTLALAVVVGGGVRPPPGPGVPPASQVAGTPPLVTAAQSAGRKTGSVANATSVGIRSTTAAGKCAPASSASTAPAPASSPVTSATPTPSTIPATSAGSGTTSSVPGATLAWVAPALVERVPVLMYHRVVPLAEAGDSLRSLVIPPELFDAQMAALKQAGWHAITLRQLAMDLAAGRREPPRTFVPTFDDGYRDGYRYAAPILRRYGFVGTFFVIAGRVGMPAYLTPAELCVMTRAGDEIANHTVHHVGLGIVPERVASAEIEQAGRMILGWTGIAPITLAYPFGSYSVTAVDLLSRDGYQLAATTIPGALETYADRLLIPRVRVGPAIGPASLLRMLGAYGG